MWQFTYLLTVPTRLCSSTAGSSPLCLCCALCLHVTPFSCTRSSRHLLRCLPLDLLPSRGCHSVTLCVHRLSPYLATCPAHFHFCFSTNWTISCTLVLFLISGYGTLSFIFKFNIFLSMALWAVLNFWPIAFDNDHLWQPYVILGRTHWSKTCLLRDIGNFSSRQTSLFLPKQLQPVLIPHLISSFVVSLRYVVWPRYLY